MYLYHLISIDLQSSRSFNTHTAKLTSSYRPKFKTMKLQLIALAAFVAFVTAVPLAEMPGSGSRRDAMPQVRCLSTSHILL
jgi:hypothetical protein